MTTWLLQVGGAPAALDQQFDASPAELTWTINDSAPVPLAMTFAAGAAPWPFFDWLAPLGYIMDVEAGVPPADPIFSLIGVDEFGALPTQEFYFPVAGALEVALSADGEWLVRARRRTRR